MGKTSQAKGNPDSPRTNSSVLESIIEVEAQVNADIEKARLASRENIADAQKTIPDLVTSLEDKAQKTAHAKEQEILHQSQQHIAKIQKAGDEEARLLQAHLDENYAKAVDYIVEQVIHTCSS